jgi:hypothetical protein
MKTMAPYAREKAFLLTLDLAYMKHRQDPELVNQLEVDAERLASWVTGNSQNEKPRVMTAEGNRLLRRVVELWDYVSSGAHTDVYSRTDADAFQRVLDAADGQLIEDVRRYTRGEE